MVIALRNLSNSPLAITWNWFLCAGSGSTSEDSFFFN